MNGLPLESPRPLAWTNPTASLLARFTLLKQEVATERGSCDLQDVKAARHDSKGIGSLVSEQAVLGMQTCMSCFHCAILKLQR